MKKKEMIPLTYEENKSYKEQEACHICQERFSMDKDDENYKNNNKVKDHCLYTGKFRGAAHSKCNLDYKIPKDIPIIIHNASYDTHFIINQLPEEFLNELNGIGENIKNISPFLYQLRKNVINKIAKIVLSSKDDKRLQSFDRITTNTYGTGGMMMIKK